MLMPIYSSYNSSTPVTAAFTASAVSTAADTAYTFSSQALGTASSTRMIVIGICGSSNSGSASTVNSVTVAGVSATKAKEQGDGTEAGYSSDLWYVALASGTSGDVVVTFDATQARTGIGLTAVYDADNSPFDTSGNSDDPMVATISCPAKGIILGSCTMNASAGVSTAWTNLTEKYDQAVEGPQSQSGAFATFASAQTDLSITSDPSAAVNRKAMALAAWGPAADAVPAYITLEAADWQGSTSTATLGSGTVRMNTGDKCIRTNDALIPAGVDFDFEVEFGDSGSASQSAPLTLGICDNGTRTTSSTPTLANTISYATSSGDPDQGGPGWKVGAGKTDSSDTYSGDHNPGSDWGGNKGGSVSNSNWMSGKIIGFSRRGSQIYGMIDGSLDYTFGNAASFTSKAVKLWIGCSGSGAWPVGASNIRYRRGGGLPDIS